jgi:hypothetical protein
MIRNPKAFPLALVAVLAMSTLLVSAAQAGGPAHLVTIREPDDGGQTRLSRLNQSKAQASWTKPS